MSGGTPVSFGERLRETRERAGWSIEQVALKLRLSVAQVTALEKGQRENLPPAPYVRGYLRSYAQLLGMDVQEFANVRGGQELPIAPLPTSAVSTRKLPLASFAYLIFLLCTILGVVWWHVHKDRRVLAVEKVTPTAQAVGALPPRLQSLATPGTSNGQLSAFPLRGTSSSIEPPMFAQAHPGTPVYVKPKLVAPPARSPGSRGARLTAPPVTHLTRGAKRPPLQKKTRAAQAAVTVVPRSRAIPNLGGLVSLPQGHHYIGLRISASTTPIRVSVRDANGTGLLATQILAGHSVRVVGRPPFRIIFSKTQGVAVKVGGRTIALPASQKGQSLRVTVGP